MMRSLYSGVSGLRVHQTKMDVIGNNISNVNTVGFKSSSVTFTDILYQTTQSASGPNGETGTAGKNAMQIGLGSNVGSISLNMNKSGSAQRTDNAFDVMINGSAFFIVNSNGSNYFTKAGSFTTDANGTLCTSTGAKVQGWVADKDGNIQADKVTDLNIMSAENKYTPPEATTKAYMSGNIDQHDKTLVTETTTTNGVTTTTGGRVVQMSIYDSKGNAYTAQFLLSSIATNTSNYHIELKDIIDSDGKSLFANGTGYTGATLGTSTISPAAAGGANGTGATMGGTANTILFNAKTGAFEGVGTAGNKTLTLQIAGGGDPFEDITIDLSALTNYSTGGTSTAEAAKGTSSTDNTGAGKKVGNMTGCSIASDGKIVGVYDNGDKKVLGQIAVATFANPAGLEAVGNSMFAATMNSGDFDGVGKDITALGEDLTTGVLEMSNVDLATEFTEMIVTQRGYQANSRIITTSDTMLEELINLKR